MGERHGYSRKVLELYANRLLAAENGDDEEDDEEEEEEEHNHNEKEDEEEEEPLWTAPALIQVRETSC